MRHRSLSHLADSTLSHGLGAAFAGEDTATANLLAYIDEFDERKLYVPAGYPSMLDYCVGKLGRSRDAARKRIHAAHTARRFPIIFELVAGGRLHLTAVILLAPRLTPENAEGLLEAAANKSKDEIRLLLAPHLPKSGMLEVVSAASAEESCAPERTKTPPAEEPCAPGRTESSPKCLPVSPERLLVHFTPDEEMGALLRRAQELLGHRLRSGEAKEVIRHALRFLVGHMEKQKSANTKPRSSQPPKSVNARHLPLEVKDAVWARDGGRCTFVSEDGHRCESRKHLEFDHIEPVARGGQSTVDNLRLRCRAHNQFEADRTFGAGFMKEKRERARRNTAESRRPDAGMEPIAREHFQDVYAGLRELGFRADEARRAAEFAAKLADATLEDCMRAALQALGRRRIVREPKRAEHRPGGSTPMGDGHSPQPRATT